MPQKINQLPITNDYIFKKIFSKKGNESILKDFLIAILDIPIEKVEVQAEVSLEKELEENKLGRLDIVAILDNKTIINIEMQISNKYNFIERNLYYWSGNYYNNLKAGCDYRNVMKTITISILDYEIFKEGPFHEIGRLKRDYQNRVLSNKLEMHFIQIPKFIKEERANKTKLDQWMQFISQANKGEVELAMKENKEIKKANEEYEYLTGDDAERRLAYLRDKAIRDENNMLAAAREEAIRQGLEEGLEQGIEQGIQQGIKQNKKEITKKLLVKNLSIDEISEITGLSREEIQEIKQH